MGTPADAHDLILAANLISSTGRHTALVARLRCRAGLDLIADSDTKAEARPEREVEHDPDFDTLARAHGGGEAPLADLWRLCESTGISGRRWPNMLPFQIDAIVGKWLTKSPWPRRRVHNRWVYSIPPTVAAPR